MSGADQPFDFVCLGTTHPHASGRVKAMQQRGGRLRAVAESDQRGKSFADRFDVPLLSAESALALPDVEVALVHSWTREMRPLCEWALRADKAVLVEKPGGTTVEDLQRLRETIEATGGFLQVGFNFRHCHVVDVTTAMLVDGVLGEVVVAHAHGAVAVGEHRAPMTNQPADIGGAFFVIGCHMVDVLIHHLGQPRNVHSFVSKRERLSDSSSREDAVVAILDFGEVTATYDFHVHDALENVESWRLDVYGTNGQLRVGYLPQFFELYLDEARGGYPAGWTRWHKETFATPWSGESTEFSPDIPEVRNTEFFAIEADRFLRAWRGGEPPCVTIRDALAVAETITACYRSAQHNGTPNYI